MEHGKASEKLKEAWDELFNTLVKSLKLKEIVHWMDRVLRKYFPFK